MGEVRGNDYNFAFFQGIPLPNVYKMVPLVEIIDLGATQIVIPDNFPIGCMPTGGLAGTAVPLAMKNSKIFRFDETATQKACCGVHDNEYNVNMDVRCGFDGNFVCENPREHISWDGIHLTHQAYHVMAKKLIPSLLDALHKVT
ncbi:hypothetical protein RND81_07G152500 [Saponaria officinalis]|uniref:Uncharacterized protein n=1 Tax=Saponaria officinalis TaxID=3572 RepID=A0AAW1JSS8_SAPOF